MFPESKVTEIYCMAAVRPRTLAHHAFKRIIGKIHRLNLPVQPAAALHAASKCGKGTSGLSASMQYAAFPPRSHRCAGAGTSGWMYSPYRGVPNKVPTGRWPGTGCRASAAAD